METPDGGPVITGEAGESDPIGDPVDASDPGEEDGAAAMAADAAGAGDGGLSDAAQTDAEEPPEGGDGDAMVADAAGAADGGLSDAAQADANAPLDGGDGDAMAADAALSESGPAGSLPEGGHDADAQVCPPGLCEPLCPRGHSLCEGACVNLLRDSQHCGECGDACPAHQLCRNGACACPAPQQACGAICTDTSSDRAHCGACDHACPNGQVCAAGVCTLSCPDGLATCDHSCVHTATDEAHCGDCTTTCAPDRVCTSGHCVCPARQQACAGKCVVFASDPMHCGACGVVCGSGEVCSNGSCVLSCPRGFVACGGSCVDTATDEAHCGSCSITCSAEQVCRAGACACPASQQWCGGRCVNVMTDANHCGACGSICERRNASAICVAGVCKKDVCAAGFGDADEVDGNGCECTISNGGDDGCDGIDNDCDGLVDWRLSDPPQSSCVCSAREYPATRYEPHESSQSEPDFPRCSTTLCTPGPEGQLVMSYCLATCDGVGAAWAVCHFAGPVDWSGFDADFGNAGVVEVVFEVLSEWAEGKLNLWYGIDPRRKYLPLIPRGERLRRGTYYRYFTPGQALFPSWFPVPPGCGDQCGACPDIERNPDFRFSTADLTLAGEGCAARVDARIRLVSVKLLSNGCRCASDADCADTPAAPRCLAPESGTGACGWPASGSIGMCGPAAECSTTIPLGSPCPVGPVGAEGATCQGTWECLDGRLVCEIASCAG